MSTPALFYGSADSGAILQAESGYSDDGADIRGLILAPYAEPASIHGDASFGPLWLELVWTAAATVKVTPIVAVPDSGGVMQETMLTAEALEIELEASATRRRNTFKFDVRTSLTEDGNEIARQAVRGQRCSFLVELTRSGEGLLMIAGFALGATAHTDQLIPANTETGA